MKFSYVLLSALHPEKYIKNIKYPSCVNCIHYRPNTYNNEFVSPHSTCGKFGDKDIVTDKIIYNFTDFCRNDDTKCGLEGKHFEEEKNINMKILNHKITNNLPYGLVCLGVTMYTMFTVYLQINYPN